MHDFCRSLLKEIMPDVRKHVPVDRRKRVYVMDVSLGHKSFEFHLPGSKDEDDFYWHGQACCKWHARYEGYLAYLTSIGAEGYCE